MNKRRLLTILSITILTIIIGMYYITTYVDSYLLDTLNPFKTYSDGRKACKTGADCKSKLCVVSNENWSKYAEGIVVSGFCSAEIYDPCNKPFSIDENGHRQGPAFCN